MRLLHECAWLNVIPWFVAGPAADAIRDLQIERLNQMFRMATDLDLPVSIHNRGAAHELLTAIHAHPGLRGVMHYFYHHPLPDVPLEMADQIVPFHGLRLTSS